MDIQSIKKAVENEFVFDEPGQTIFTERDAINYLLEKVEGQKGWSPVDSGDLDKDPELIPEIDRRQRDRFLALAIGDGYQENYWFCRRCDDVKESGRITDTGMCMDCDCLAEWCDFYDFSTWPLLGKLITWSRQQEWWQEFVAKWIFRGPDHAVSFAFGVHRTFELFEPNSFADAVFSYLKRREDLASN